LSVLFLITLSASSLKYSEMCYISTKSTKFKMSDQNQYTEDNIRSLDWKEHIRMRPGMYIGKLGDGSSPDDGIYIL
jgi:hypothetical protein